MAFSTGSSAVMWQWRPVKKGIRGALFPEFIAIFSSVQHWCEWRRLPELADPRYETGTEAGDWFHFRVPSFHSTLLSSSADCTGAARECSSEIVPEVRPLAAFPAGWGREYMGTCSVSPGVPGVTLHSLHPAAATLAMAKARLGTCSFGHVDTSGELLCPLLMAGNNLSDARVPKCVWGCSCCNHDVPDSDTTSVPARILCQGPLSGTALTILGHKVPSSTASHGQTWHIMLLARSWRISHSHRLPYITARMGFG